MEKAQHPIGIFDSGIGGLTVANAILRHLPSESFIYFGDTAHMPYGDKSMDAIRYYSLKISKFLIDKGCKSIVIACNSASSAAYHVLTEFFKGQISFVNVVDPLVQYTVSKGYQKVGVIATKATIQSKMYEQKLIELQPGLEVVSKATPLLAPMIEEGFVNNHLSISIIENYLSATEFEGIDAILLACTHYPLIKEQISQFWGHRVDVIDSADLTAIALKKRLDSLSLLNKTEHIPTHQFYVSDLSPSFEASTRIFLNRPIELEHTSIW
jgi:glutamate racemase